MDSKKLASHKSFESMHFQLIACYKKGSLSIVVILYLAQMMESLIAHNTKEITKQYKYKYNLEIQKKNNVQFTVQNYRISVENE